MSGIALLGLIAFGAVHASLLLRWLHLESLRREIDRLYATVERGRDPSVQRRRWLDQIFEDSPIAETWRELKRRRSQFGASDPTQRAPARILDLLEENPLLPRGRARALLPALPGAFLALGLFETFAGIALAAPELLRGEDTARGARAPLPHRARTHPRQRPRAAAKAGGALGRPRAAAPGFLSRAHPAVLP